MELTPKKSINFYYRSDALGPLWFAIGGAALIAGAGYGYSYYQKTAKADSISDSLFTNDYLMNTKG